MACSVRFLLQVEIPLVLSTIGLAVDVIFDFQLNNCQLVFSFAVFFSLSLKMMHRKVPLVVSNRSSEGQLGHIYLAVHYCFLLPLVNEITIYVLVVSCLMMGLVTSTRYP